jgi:hypothetical protein
MDIIDSGSETAQFFLDIELKRQRAQGTVLPFTGRCHNCDEPVDAPACFCNTGGDTGCQEDYEKRAATKRKTHA